MSKINKIVNIQIILTSSCKTNRIQNQLNYKKNKRIAKIIIRFRIKFLNL
jgi:hypothetical protein